jgi:hypothetical protein
VFKDESYKKKLFLVVQIWIYGFDTDGSSDHSSGTRFLSRLMTESLEDILK